MVPSDSFQWYVFGQGSLNVTGDSKRRNRLGFGGEVQVGKDWSIQGEVSDGATGVGGRILFGQDKGEESNVYFGYTLDPDRTRGRRRSDRAATGASSSQAGAGATATPSRPMPRTPMICSGSACR